MKPLTFKFLIFTIAIAMGLVGWVTIFGNEGWLAYRHLTQAEGQMQQRIADLKHRNHQLSRDIYRLKHDKDYLERVVRKELDMGKPDELVFKFR